VAFADIAVNEALGHPLLAVSHGIDWNEQAITVQAVDATRKKRLVNLIKRRSDGNTTSPNAG
jgi:hypothetical protein